MDETDQVLWFGEKESMQIRKKKKKVFGDYVLHWKARKMKLENKVSRERN